MVKVKKLLKEAETARDNFFNAVKELEDEILGKFEGINVNNKSYFGIRYFDITTKHYSASNFLESEFKIEVVSCGFPPETEEEMLKQMKEMVKENQLIKEVISYIDMVLED